MTNFKQISINRGFIISCAAAVIMFFTFTLLYFKFPSGYLYFTAEDYLGEYFTAAGYFTAFLLTAAGIIRHRELRNPVIIILALFCLGVAGEEISWGQRILKIATPESMYIANNQGEMNLHNMSYVKNTKLIFTVLVGLWSVILPVLAWKFRSVKKLADRLCLPLPSASAVPFFAAGILLYIFRPIPKSDELDELFYSLGFLGTAAMLLACGRKKENVYTSGDGFCFAWAAGLTLLISCVLTSLFPWQEDMKERQLQFACSIYPSENLMKNSQKIFDNLLAGRWKNSPDVRTGYASFLRMQGKTEEADNLETELLLELKSSVNYSHEDPEYHKMLAGICRNLNRQNEYTAELKNAAALYRKHFNEEENNMKKIDLLCSLSYVSLSLNDRETAFLSLRKAYELCRNKSERAQILKTARNIFIKFQAESF